MAMRDLFQGGACNINEQQEQQSRQMNPFTQFIDQALMGQSEQQQHIMRQQEQQQGMNRGINDQEIQQRQNNFQKMEEVLRGEEDQRIREQMQLHQQMDIMWREEQRAVAEQQALHQQQMETHYQQEQAKALQEQLANQLTMQESYQQAQQDKTREVSQLDKEVEQQVIQHSTGNIIEVMMKDPEPKFQNSQFLQFLQKIQQGKLVIQGDQLLEGNQQIMEDNEQMMNKDNEQMMDQAFEQSHKEYQEHMKENLQILGDGWNEAEEQQKKQQEQQESLWDQAVRDEQKMEEYLEAEYKTMLQELAGGNEQDMNKAWQAASDYEENALYSPKQNSEYIFKQNNPFVGDEQAYSKALGFYNAGQVAQAVLALEAHLQLNQQHSQAWRVLGRILQQNDQDQPAITCLLKALEKVEHIEDKQDILYNLGISCTNILNEVKAIQYLAEWLQLVDPQAQLDMQWFSKDNHSLDEVKQMNDYYVHQFQQSLQRMAGSPHKCELLQSLSTLHFIQRDYQSAIELFQESLKEQPQDFSLWNKLGATCAHLGQSEQAIQAYHQALAIKPNFVRVWVNLGIAHAFQGDYQEAARFYLNALNLNPDAKHLWTYLHSTFVCMQRYDLLPLLEKQDINVFKDHFDVIEMEDLPGPEIDYAQSNMKFVIRKAEDWSNQIIQQEQQQQQM